MTAVRVIKFEPAPNVLPVVAKDDGEHIVWGWASVVTENGVPVVDSQGDEIPVDVMQKAVHQFMAECRVGKVHHQGDQKADIVDSLFFSKAIQDALGIDLKKEGWFVGWRTRDAEAWQAVQAGDYTMFSIGGTCEYDEAA